MEKIQYTGLNFTQIKEFCDGKVLAPYFCMGFTMLSLMTEDGFVTVNEGDWICRDENGRLSVQ